MGSFKTFHDKSKHSIYISYKPIIKTFFWNFFFLEKFYNYNEMGDLNHERFH